MARGAGIFRHRGSAEGLKELSAKGDALERLSAVVDFELFRADIEHAVARSDRSRGGRPPFDHVLMFKTLLFLPARRSPSVSQNVRRRRVQARLNYREPQDHRA